MTSSMLIVYMAICASLPFIFPKTFKSARDPN